MATTIAAGTSTTCSTGARNATGTAYAAVVLSRTGLAALAPIAAQASGAGRIACSIRCPTCAADTTRTSLAACTAGAGIAFGWTAGTAGTTGAAITATSGTTADTTSSAARTPGAPGTADSTGAAGHTLSGAATAAAAGTANATISAVRCDIAGTTSATATPGTTGQSRRLIGSDVVTVTAVTAVTAGAAVADSANSSASCA